MACFGFIHREQTTVSPEQPTHFRSGDPARIEHSCFADGAVEMRLHPNGAHQERRTRRILARVEIHTVHPADALSCLCGETARSALSDNNSRTAAHTSTICALVIV